MKTICRLAINSIITIVFLVAVNMPVPEAIAAVVTYDFFLFLQEEVLKEFRR